MGMVVMSTRELNRLDVLARLDSDRLTARAAAELMAITSRQAYRLLRRYRDGGATAIANQRPGRPSNTRFPDVVRDHAIAQGRESRICRLRDGWEVWSFCSRQWANCLHQPPRRSSGDAGAPSQSPMSRKHGPSFQSLSQARQQVLIASSLGRRGCLMGGSGWRS